MKIYNLEPILIVVKRLLVDFNKTTKSASPKIYYPEKKLPKEFVLLLVTNSFISKERI